MSTFTALGLLFTTICSFTSISAKDGFILTVPRILRYGTTSEMCVTLYANDQRLRPITTSLISTDDGAVKAKVNTLYVPGAQKCTSFVVPEPGDYELLMTNETDILHDSVEVTVMEAKPITLVQTDKPMYKPGQKVKFRVMTLLTDLTPRVGKINSIFIKDPNQIRVKQYLNVETKGLASLQFQLSSEAKLGEWQIDVIMVDKTEGSSEPISSTFEVKEYVLPRFEVEIKPPSYILADSELVHGSVCAKYTYGKPVQGFLDLKVCWGHEHVPNMPCDHNVVKVSGCSNFTVNITALTSDQPYYYYGTQLQISASVTELGTGAVVNKTHSGPRRTHEPLQMEIEDYTNGFFKPRLPYIGKVTVKRPDGSPAVGELIRIVAKDFKKNLRYSGNFTTDITGAVSYALCEAFTENTTSISIEAEAVIYEENNDLPYRRRLNKPRAYKQVKQWFSPSLSYIQIPRSDLNLKCGDHFTHGIPFTTRTGRNVTFIYQVLARGQVVKTGRVTHDTSVNFPGAEVFKPPQRICLQWEEEPSKPPPPPEVVKPVETIEISFTSEVKELEPPSIEDVDAMSDDDLPGDDEMPPLPDGDYGDDYTDEEDTEDIAPPEPDVLPPEPPRPPEPFEEPIIRPDVLSDHMSTLLLDMEISTVMAPSFTLLVYHVMADGEVVADSMEFQVETCFANKVKMDFNTSTALPGEKVGIDLKAAPGSVCGVGIVDKSINILGGKHQITSDTVFKKIKELGEAGMARFVPYGYHSRDNNYCEKRIKSLKESSENSDDDDEMYWHYNSPYVDAIQAFRAAGFTVLSNLDLETRPCGRNFPIYYYDSFLRRGTPGMVPDEMEEGSMPGPMTVRGQPVNKLGSSPKSPLVRTKFPETWLWDIVLIGEKGQANLTETAPDTITSWVGNALCVDKTKGFGVSPMTSVITFQPFFLSLHLPYSAVRGERLPVILTVYNYLDKCLRIEFTLDAGDSFVIHRKHRKPICLCGGKSHSSRYYTTPKGIGSLEIMAKAIVVPGKCGSASNTETRYVGYSDAVRRKMLVKAEGVTQEYTSTLYMCTKAGDPKTEEVILPLPEDMVPDSARGELRVIGDIMGPALTNLDNLVRMPTGCGEQNMVGFVPNILVLKYLTNTGRLTEKIKDDAVKYMEAGYQRELNYRHKDGSYSAFGEKHSDGASGSVWLTAFVVKSFAQAQPFIYIDDADMALSINFLRRSQLETGCFRETGKVFSSYMMGGLGKDKKEKKLTALTAYVLAALIHANVNKTDRVIIDAMECINRDFQVEKTRLDPYTLSLVAYANTLYKPHNSHVATSIMKALDRKVKKDGSLRYWGRDSDTPKPVNTWYYYAAPSAEVEMTSYALLSYLNFYGESAVAQAHDITMWISQQRSPRGGFASTQDTVVGLNALAEFAELAYDDEPKDVEVVVRGDNLDSRMRVSEFLKTTLLLQTAPIPTLPGQITIHTRGVGCALVQANVQFNKLVQNLGGEEKPSFHLKVSQRPYVHNIDRCDRRTIDISVGARGSQKFNSGMALVTVRMVTSWTPVKDSLIMLESLFPILGMKRYEHNEEEGVLTFYFESLDRKYKRFSIDVEQDRALKVSHTKAAEVRVFQYYETDVSRTTSYKLRTTCGTKLEIPRKLPADTPPWVQRRIDLPSPIRRPVPASVSTCPVCRLTSVISPDDLKKLICNSSSIYKVIAGRPGAKPLKIKGELLEGTKMNLFAKYEMDDSCQCVILAPPVKRIVVFGKDKITDKKVLKLDGRSTIFKANKKIEKEIKKLHTSCSA